MDGLKVDKPLDREALEVGSSEENEGLIVDELNVDWLEDNEGLIVGRLAVDRVEVKEGLWRKAVKAQAQMKRGELELLFAHDIFHW